MHYRYSCHLPVHTGQLQRFPSLTPQSESSMLNFAGFVWIIDFFETNFQT